MSDPSTDAVLSVLESSITGMSENIAQMRKSVDDMTRELRKVAVLEEKHSNHDSAITRAFAEIENQKRDLRGHEESDRVEHDRFKKAIWFTSGFACAVTILWTVLGVYLVDSVKENINAIAEIKAHTLNPTLHAPRSYSNGAPKEEP